MDRNLSGEDDLRVSFFTKSQRKFKPTKIEMEMGNAYMYINYILYIFKVDGQWADWMAWTSCSSTCGDSVRTRARTCTNPAPSQGGQDCAGSSQESHSCHMAPCSGKYYQQYQQAFRIINSIHYMIHRVLLMLLSVLMVVLYWSCIKLVIRPSVYPSVKLSCLH